MSTNPGFWDKIADRYAKQPIADEEAYQTKLNKSREYFQSSSIVLEFGCGTGSTALSHAPFAQHIEAIDVSANMLAKCQQKRQAAGIDNVSFQQSTIEAFPLKAEYYDVILGLSILHLLENKDVVLNKVYQMLKPGGYFISSTMCLGDSMPWLRFVAPIGLAIRKLPLVRCLKENELQKSFKDQGFVIEHRWQPNAKSALFFVVQKPEKKN